jgi:hypothetical protein
MTFGPFGLLGSAAGIKTPLDVQAGPALLGGAAGAALFGKKSAPELPPQGQNDPRVRRSTDSAGYGRGSSSLSV